MKMNPPAIRGFYYRPPGIGPILFAAVGFAGGVAVILWTCAPYIAALLMVIG